MATRGFTKHPRLQRVDSRARHVDLHDAPEPIAAEHGHVAILEALIHAVMPSKILELGAGHGYSAERMGEAIIALGLFGRSRVTTIERDFDCAEATMIRCRTLPVHVIRADYDDVDLDSLGPFDLVHLDADWDRRVHEVQLVLPHVTPGAVLVLHDMGDASPGHDAIEPLRDELGLSIVELWTPRGTVIAQVTP